jgi:hypothetical protein
MPAFLTFPDAGRRASERHPYCATTSGCTAPIMNVPKDTASLALVYTTNLMQNYQLTARIADIYVGSSFDEAYFFGFQLPSYSIANARIGVSNDKVVRQSIRQQSDQ